MDGKLKKNAGASVCEIYVSKFLLLSSFWKSLPYLRGLGLFSLFDKILAQL